MLCRYCATIAKSIPYREIYGTELVTSMEDMPVSEVTNDPDKRGRILAVENISWTVKLISLDSISSILPGNAFFPQVVLCIFNDFRCLPIILSVVWVVGIFDRYNGCYRRWRRSKQMSFYHAFCGAKGCHCPGD